jgi:Protein of unknown function (DUF642)/PEP-CTERM motif
MKLPALVALAAATAIASPAAAAVNLIVNGDFESPAAPSHSFTIFGSRNQGLTGWTVLGPGGNSVALLATDYTEPNVAFEAEHGQASLDLSGGDNTGPTAGISQDVATTIGQAYVLDFWLGNADGNNNYTLPSTLTLAFDGGQAFPFTNATITPRGVNWQEISIAFRAARTTTNIAFLNATPKGDAFTGLDNVSFRAVPEPAAWTMMIGGFGLAGAALRRRRLAAA